MVRPLVTRLRRAARWTWAHCPKRVRYRHGFLLAPVALVAVGVSMIHPPSGLIVAGVLLAPWLLQMEDGRGDSP